MPPYDSCTFLNRWFKVILQCCPLLHEGALEAVSQAREQFAGIEACCLPFACMFSDAANRKHADIILCFLALSYSCKEL